MKDLVNGLIEATMMIKRKRMRLEVVARTRGEITQIISMSRTIEEEEEEEGKELEEEAFVENVSTTVKKGIAHLNVLNTKEGMNGRVELQLLMKMQSHRILKMLKEEKF